ncbi:MAG TPA: hypothetical protein VNN20_05170 [Thermodesulfobacteriota bacterium]|nr:hypothetical protein [Thermodesulfobacteriota bacterium]
MRKLSLVLVVSALLAIILTGTKLDSFAANLSQIIIGQVTMVGDRMLRIKEDGTQREYELRATPGQLVNVISGYRVEAKTTDGNLSSLTILGMPMKAAPEPFQKWTVIIKPSPTQ